MRLMSSVLAVLSTAVVVGCISAGSASATALCEFNESPCEAPIPEGTEVSGGLEFGKTAVFKGALGVEVVCSTSSLTGEITWNPAGIFPMGQVTTWSFSNCTLGKNSCTVAVLQTPYIVDFQPTGSGNGLAFIGPNGNGQPGVTFGAGCGVLNGCTFKYNEEFLMVKEWARLSVIGSLTEPRIEASQVALKSSFFCGGTSGRWNAVYYLSSPSSMFVVL